ncbi:hypothetical protein FRC02_006667 [Tulasnella sp. 418]|nr:hypothetical protein FRC02_006667 [Tulasnella sp. 418]
MSDEVNSNPTTQSNGGAKRTQGGGRNVGRGQRKAPPVNPSDPSAPAASTSSANGSGAGSGNAGNRPRNTNNSKKGSPNPNSGGAKLAAPESISRPSSTDGSTAPRSTGGGGSSGGGRGKPRNNPGNQNRRPSGRQNSGNSGTNAAAANGKQPGAPAGATNTNGAQQPATNAAQGSETLSSIQRVITDMKSASSATAPTAVTSNLPVNAPVFQPGAGVYPPPNATTDAPRHRKANTMGGSPSSYTSPAFSSPLNNFSPNLGVMQEQVGEDGEYEDETADAVPTAVPSRHIQSSSMGNFTAPRFAAMANQQPNDPEGAVGSSARPQLAPNFTFGQRRGMAGMAPLNEEDPGFQFPQTQGVRPDFQQAQLHRRTPSDMAGVSPLMAEQLAIQSQIEALQQQQQQLLQQQIATNTVMQSFQNSPQLGRGGGNVHRRIQSQQVPMGMGAFPGVGFNNMGNFGVSGGIGLGLASGQDTTGRGNHGRRHSVNVINKAAEQGAAAAQNNIYGGGINEADAFDDGFAAPQPGGGAGGHSRQASRADSGWRANGGNQGGAFDLAQAQAQLQSLQQFRAAAGGHHQKMASFSFPNMLPNVMAANMMGMSLGGLNYLQQQQQQFQMQLQQQNQGPQRKSLFAPYLPQASLPPLLAAGKLVVGILRVNKRNRSDAYVATEVLDSDIYICGSKDRNRALEGDIVAVELLDVDEVWGTKKEKEEKKRKKEENSAYDIRSITGRKNDKKKDDVEVEGQGLTLFEDEEVTDEVKPQFAGHVVAVVERMPGQLFSGTLGLLRPSSAATKEKQDAERRERGGMPPEEENKPMERPKIVWFKPTDKRVPLIAIPTEQAPPDFVNNSEAYADRLFVACIKRHPISSLHPFGTLVEELGPIGNVEVETSALLKDCNFPTEEFSENVIKCVPPIPWTIPEREYEVRRDLRSERIFTIDPSRAKDLDDAISLKQNEDGNYEVGVHIADVSYFVKPNTALDRDARKRATTVYLVQRAVPMLPPTLCEELCSLNPGVERLAFSVIFTMTPEAKILNKWFGRTIIKSAGKLSYEDAQKVIDGSPLPTDLSVTEGHQASDIANDIKTLYDLSAKLQKKRLGGGTLRIDSYRLSFELDANGAPVDCHIEQRTPAKSLIEELMLLTNIAVAQQIAVHLPEQALLRRHEDPIDRRLNAFAERALRMGYTMDVSSAGALQRSFETIDDPMARRMLEMLSTKAMHRAKYFCSGMLDIAKYSHYALNVPLYSHFTSPIRRYADVIAHRQLDSILNGSVHESKFNMDRDAVAKIAQQCNIKKDSAKLAQEQSAHLFLCLLISDLTHRYGPVIRQARVVGVLDAAFDVHVPEFGIEKRVHVDQMPIDTHTYDEHSHTLQIYWSDKDVISWLAENSDDEHLKKVKRNAEQHAAKMEVNSLSVHDESALFEEDEEEDEIVLHRNPDSFRKEEPVKETSKQRLLSAAKITPEFEGLRTTAAGQNIQDIREMMTVPVIVTADLTKSPPVIKVYSVNPYARKY